MKKKSDRPPAWQIILVWIGLVALFLVASFFFQAKAQSQIKPPISALAQKMGWPLMPKPALPPLGQTPETPKLKPISFAVTKQLTSTQFVALYDRLLHLLTTHPLPEIRTEMNPLILDAKIQIRIIPRTSLVGAFYTLTSRQILKLNPRARVQPDQIYPFIELNSVELAKLVTEPEILAYWRTLFHEFHHFNQWRTAKMRAERDFFARINGRKINPAYCTQWWIFERETYFKECQLALKWGLPNTWEGLCARVGSKKAFDQFFLALIKKNQGDLFAKCKVTFMTLAGHPRPKAVTP